VPAGRLLPLIFFQRPSSGRSHAAACFGEVVSDRADIQPPASAGRASSPFHEFRALLARFDLAGDTDLGGERHVDEEPAGE